MKPVIMSRAKWIKDTALFARKRGDALAAVDTALMMFETGDPNQWPNNLKLVKTNLETWLASKTSAQGELSTKRSHSTIRTLQIQIAAGLQGQEPELWNGDRLGIYLSTDIRTDSRDVPSTWKGQTQLTLKNMQEDPCGRLFIEMLSAACLRKNQRVVISFGSNQCAPVAKEVITNNDRRLEPNLAAWMANPNIVATGVDRSGETPRFIENTGASALVLFNPDLPAGPDGDRVTWVALAHEMVHAYHFVTGTCPRVFTGSTNMDSGLSEEEMRTIGCSDYDGEIPSENWFRESTGDPKRTTYSGYDFSNTHSTLAG